MDLQQIGQLLEILQDRDVAEFRFEDQDIKLRLRFGAQPAAVVAMPAAAPVAVAPVAAASPAAAAAPAAAEGKGVTVESPMVGTFYSAPSPDADPFVAVGTRVSKGQVLCIIEAMKLMNEIESEVAGTVTEVLVDNSQPVQFGQALFTIDPGS